MNRRKYRTKKADTTLNDINKGVQTLAEASEKTGEKLDDIKSNTDELVRSSKARMPLVIAIIGAVATVIGTIATIIGIIISSDKPAAVSLPDKSDTDTIVSTYEIYLYPDYKRVKVGFQTDITATLNFDTDSVNIDAYLNSVHNGDTVIMTQKNSSEWQAKVYFQETGTFKVVATATAPDSTIMEKSTEIEVVPANMND